MFRNSQTRILISIVSLIFVFSFIFGCAGKKPIWGNAETGYILTYRLADKGVLKYEAKTVQTTNQEMMGQSIEVVTDIYNNYSITGAGKDEQMNVKSKVQMDSISMVSKSPRGERSIDLSEIVGKNFGFTFSPLGKQVEFSNPDSVSINLGPMGGKRGADSFFSNLLPNLPANPVKIGETWTEDNERTEDAGGMAIKVKTNTVSKIEGMETINGVDCFKISGKITGTLDGEGQQMGADIVFEGDLEGTSTWFFAFKEGKFVKLTSSILSEGTAAVSGGANMTIPISQETKSEINLIK